MNFASHRSTSIYTDNAKDLYQVIVSQVYKQRDIIADFSNICWGKIQHGRPERFSDNILALHVKYQAFCVPDQSIVRQNILYGLSRLCCQSLILIKKY